MFAFYMKTTVLTFAIVTILSGSASARDLVPWVDNLAQARQLAASSKKLLIVHFWDQNCPPCRFLEEEVFAQPIFAHTLSKHYVPVKINVSASPDITRHFQVTQWPMDVILSPDGQVQHKMVSPRSINEYMRILTEVAWRSNDAQRVSGIQSPGYADAQRPATALAGMQGQQALQLKQEVQRVEHQEANLQTQFAITNPAATTAVPATAAAAVADVPIYNDYVIPTKKPANQQALSQSPPQMVKNQFYQGAAGAAPPPTKASTNSPLVIENKYFDEAETTDSHMPPVAKDQLDPTTPQTEIVQQHASPQETPATISATSDQLQQSSTAAGNRRSSSVFDGLILSPPTASAGRPSAKTTQAPTGFPGTQPMLDSVQNPMPPTSAVSQDDLRLALDGYCPVALRDLDEWVRGDRRWGARHRGQTFVFHSAAAQQRFLAEPDKFSPALGGFDPIEFSEQGRYARGTRAHGVRYKGQMYLFESEQNLAKFWSTPWKYAQVIQQAMRASDVPR